jgi:hypothetical protein
MSHKPKPTPFIQPTAPRQETKPMPFTLPRALDLVVSVLIVILSVSTGAATAFLHA